MTASVTGRQDQPVVVALGAVDPALVAGVLDGHCRFAADPAWRTRRAAHPGGHPAGHPRTKENHR